MENKHYIFLGDSITEWGSWEELFPLFSISNMGVAGDTVNQVFSRIGHRELECEKLFLLIGVNNLGDGDSVSKTISDYKNLLELLLSKLSENKINLISVLPIDENVWLNAKFSNQSIGNLNLEIEKLAKEYGLKFLKLNEVFVTYSGKEKLYIDGLHLSEKGYKIYSEELLKHL